MRRLATACLLMALMLPAPLMTAQSPPASESWDAKLRALPDSAAIKETARRLSARPHHLGSPYGKDNAEWLLAQFKSYGWDAKIEQFDVLFPTPKERVVELIAPTRFRARLQEPALAVESATSVFTEGTFFQATVQRDDFEKSFAAPVALPKETASATVAYLRGVKKDRIWLFEFAIDAAHQGGKFAMVCQEGAQTGAFLMLEERRSEE